jgi:glycosyltransferase involved in cell wall biosynthesis
MTAKSIKSILMVLNEPYPNDIRIKKETDSLIQQGHRVTLICQKRKYEADTEIIQGLVVVRFIYTRFNLINLIYDQFGNLFHSYNKLLRFIQNHIFKNPIDLIHIHDLPLAIIGHRIHITQGIPWVLDLHENFPDATQTWFSWRKNVLIRVKNSMLFQYNKLTHYEYLMCVSATKIIAVVDEMKIRLYLKHGVNKNKITIIANTSATQRQEKLIHSHSLLDPNAFNLVYLGGIGPHRGIDTCIEGLVQLKETIQSIHFHVFGSGHPDSINHLKKLVSAHNITDFVTFHGHIDLRMALEVINISTINIIPHNSNAHTNNTVPHKLYQCIGTGVPLLVSDCDPLRRICCELGIANVFEAGNSTSLANEVIQIYNNYPQYQNRAKEATERLAISRHNWQTDEAHLLELIESI